MVMCHSERSEESLSLAKSLRKALVMTLTPMTP